VALREFKLLFSPDVQGWPAYKLNAMNPGQTFYNLVVDGDGTVDVAIVVPYPYVTQGANPLHVYDSDLVGHGTDSGNDCFLPPEEASQSNTVQITIDDYAGASRWYGDVQLVCIPGGGDPATPGDLYGKATCTIHVPVDIDASWYSGQAYVNLHLDYGLKGKDANGNPIDYACVGGPDAGNPCDPNAIGPCGGNGTCEPTSDRYDRGLQISPWLSADALYNTLTGDGPVAIPDCLPHEFGHVVDPAGLDPEVFDDTVQNLNIFKKIAGVFGRVWTSSDTLGVESVYVATIGKTEGICDSPGTREDGNQCSLTKPGKCEKSGGTCRDLVKDGVTDQDGFYLNDYKKTGKSAPYVVWADLDDDGVRDGVCSTTDAECDLEGDGSDCSGTCEEIPNNCVGDMWQPVTLKANGWVEVNFDLTTCTSTAEGGPGGGNQ
jgi:hypothetical protein